MQFYLDHKQGMLNKNQGLPDELQSQLNAMILKLVDADLARFWVFFPRQNFRQGTYSKIEKQGMEAEYERHFSDKDPMHTSRYENTDVTVISNSMLMTLAEWQASEIYQQFFKPHGYCHDVDTFFRQDGKIIGVLTLLRSDEARPFTDEEVARLRDIQPFMEYVVSNTFLPERISERQTLSAKYALTVREMDVMEYALTGLSNKELIRHLKMSLPTLRTHLQNIYLKVGVHSTGEMISRVLREVDPSVDFDSLIDR